MPLECRNPIAIKHLSLLWLWEEKIEVPIITITMIIIIIIQKIITIKCLVWDFTCVNTIARPHIIRAASQAGSPSSAAEAKKIKKILVPREQLYFYPHRARDAWTMGSWGRQFCSGGGQASSLTPSKMPRYSQWIPIQWPILANGTAPMDCQ